MAGYQPLYIKAMEQGLVQSRQEFILPDDAYPTLENAFVWRERIKRKQGFKLVGRLRRILTGQALGNTTGGGSLSKNLISTLSLQSTAQIEVGSVVVVIGALTFTDNGLGILVSSGAGSGTINYATSALTITGAGGGLPAVAAFNYYPGLPVMGLRQEELNATNAEKTIAFDTVYAYEFVSGAWREFIAGTTWTGFDYNFFWSTNYWVGDGNLKIFWTTNFSGTLGDPIRYTNGSAWADFAPTIDAVGNKLTQCLVMLPFRSRMVVGNTLEGNALATSVSYPNRIRWSAIGNPFSDVSAIVTTVNAKAWKDDIRGQGGFLDIPTSESIISFGYVRDNLVVYCESSTWQLRYTGRSIAPFQIERVDSELGAESTFSTVQFDTSLVGVGNRGIVKCDSFSSMRIDIKIPDLVFNFNNLNHGTERVHGIRDFIQMLSFWTYPFQPEETPYEVTYPNRRLVYNYENESWAIFTESLTTLGIFQPVSSPKWSDFPRPSPANKWQAQNNTWFSRQALQPDIIGGNQQGYVEFLDWQASSDESLYISDITGGGPTVVITSPNHNLITGQVIQIDGILSTDPFFALDDGIYGVDLTNGNANTFEIFSYSSDTQDFDIPVVVDAGTYLGGAQISVRDGFSVVSKKFNFADDGQNIQLGFIDVLMDNTSNGAVTLNVYLDYNDSTPINRLPENLLDEVSPSTPDTFFNAVVPTTRVNGLETSKNWQRVFCPVRGAFITLEWTLSNAQLNGVEQECDVQIDSQILYLRKAGRQLPVGV